MPCAEAAEARAINTNQHTARDAASPPPAARHNTRPTKQRGASTHTEKQQQHHPCSPTTKNAHTHPRSTPDARAPTRRDATHTHTQTRANAVQRPTASTAAGQTTTALHRHKTKNTQRAARRSNSAQSWQTDGRGAHGAVDTKGGPRRIRHPAHHCHPRHSADRGARTHLPETCCEPSHVSRPE